MGMLSHAAQACVFQTGADFTLVFLARVLGTRPAITDQMFTPTHGLLFLVCKICYQT
jgi:hypothetical protein